MVHAIFIWEQAIKMTSVSVSKQLEAHLTLLMAKQPAILAIIAFSPDGLVISSIIQPGQDKEQISALSAMLLKNAMRATSSFNFGEFKRILLVSEKGYLTVLNATEDIKIAMLSSQKKAFAEAFKDLVKIAGSLDAP